VTAVDRPPVVYQPPPPRSSRTIGWAIGRGIVWLVYALVIFAIIIATLAFFLQLLGANPNADFAAWVYRSAARVTAPFRGIFPTHTITDDSELDVSLLFAIIMYAIFALLMSELISWIDRRRDKSAQRDLYEQQQAEAVAAQPATATARTTSHRSQKRPTSV
jgi:uncharacterized protein YggT (Ycf19 family)